MKLKGMDETKRKINKLLTNKYLTEISENVTSEDDTPVVKSAGAGDGLNVHLEGDGDVGDDGGVLQDLNIQ